MSHKILFAVLSTCLFVALVQVGFSQGVASANPAPGDRLGTGFGNIEGLGMTSLSRETYRLGPGDTLSVKFQGRSTVSYSPLPKGMDQVVVSPSGDVYLALLGNLHADGKTVAELEGEIREGLSKYLKHFTIDLLLVQPHTLFVSVGGAVEKSGPQAFSGVATTSLAVLQAGILSTGSVRKLELTRGGTMRTVDLYRMLVLGDLVSDIDLQPGDKLYVPPMTRYVDVDGEVIRGGRYEMVTLGGSEEFRVRDAVVLCLGMRPTAALDKISIERITGGNKTVALDLDLTKGMDSPDTDRLMQPGDRLVVPSIATYQPIIRMVGEFKGDGVYQRIDGKEIENKSGIYSLKEGQSAFDIILSTGGITPQADLKKAYIERDGVKIPLNLEHLLVAQNKSADVPLVNGDVLVLPALEDKVHVFGEVESPGSIPYSPSRKLIDYLGAAGGTTKKSRLSDIRILRGTAESPVIIKADVKNALQGRSQSDNPTLEPGDIVYVPSKFIGDWREAMQLIFTSLSLNSMLNKF
ncbi:MAG: polysaccharide biosynthesis/export family protein [Armatimonadota bacterium]